MTTADKTKQSLLKHRQDVIDWNKTTFPEYTEYQQLVKFNNELGELIEAKHKGDYDDIMFETADCVIASFGMARFNEKQADEMLDIILERYCSDLAVLPIYVKAKFEVIKLRKYDKNGQHL